MINVSAAIISDICTNAKKLKPSYVRFHSRDNHVFCIFSGDGYLLGFCLGDAKDVVDITVDAASLFAAIKVVGDSVSFTFNATNVEIVSGRSKSNLMAMGARADELVNGVHLLFQKPKNSHDVDVIPDIMTTLKKSALQRESIIGWQLSEVGNNVFCTMTDRTTASLLWLEKDKPSEKIIKNIVNIPEKAAYILLTLHKNSKNPPSLYVGKNSVGYVFSNSSMSALVISADSVESSSYSEAIYKMATDENNLWYESTQQELLDCITSTDGFSGKFIQIECGKEMILLFESPAAKLIRKIGTRVAPPEKEIFNVSYDGFRNVVKTLKKGKVRFRAALDESSKIKALLFEQNTSTHIIVCGA